MTMFYQSTFKIVLFYYTCIIHVLYVIYIMR